MVDVAINQAVLEFFDKRGIDGETVIRTGIYSGKRQSTGDSWKVVPDPKGDLIVYPYYCGGVVVNEKYRGPEKKFFQMPGGQKCFWNVDILDDPSLQDGTQALLITEGENDALAAMEAGLPFVVSVPDGAPPPLKSLEREEDIDPEHDDKFSYILPVWDKLKKIKRIIIASDADSAGQRLAEELVRRLGRVRCQFIEYPPDCKDLNEVLLEHGRSGVLDIVNSAKPYPVSGLYTFDELPPEPPVNPLSTGWRQMDPILKVYFPSFMVVTGKANLGKTLWTNQLVAQLNLLHGLKVAIASFEMRINPFVSDVLLAVHEQHDGTKEVDCRRWLNQNFCFIAPEPDDDNNSFDVEWLISRAEDAVIRYGIRILLIDPWNEIEHAVGRRENLTDYISRAIRLLKRFGRKFDCLVILVAHPSKHGAEKDPNKIDLYDVSDSQHFANKADQGVTVARIEGSNESDIVIQKVRYQPLTGTKGQTARLTYDTYTRIFV